MHTVNFELWKRAHGRRKLWQLQLYNVSTQINFTIFQLQQRGGVRTYRTCVSSICESRKGLSSYSITITMHRAHIFFQWSRSGMHPESVYIACVSPFFGALLLSRSSVYVLCALSDARLMTRICLCIQSQTAFIRSLTANNWTFCSGIMQPLCLTCYLLSFD